jgi:hypothetical protein
MSNDYKYVSVALLLLPLLLGQSDSHRAAEFRVGTVTNCPDALEMPSYPPLAWAARIVGRGTAAITLDTNGIEAVKVAGLHPLLVAEVTQSIRHSKFGSCGRRELTLAYDFVIEGDEAPSRITRIIVLSGNHFVIKVNPPRAME